MPESSARSVPAGLSIRLYDELTRAIVSGELAPGEKLSEPVIARRHGASRAPVREAIRRLQQRGLVTYAAHQGVRVAQPTAREFLALLDVREANEGMAARLAAANMSAAEAEALEALVAGHRGDIERNPEGAYLQEEPEADFHIRIARARPRGLARARPHRRGDPPARRRARRNPHAPPHPLGAHRAREGARAEGAEDRRQ
jgi:DNA-binding GntR family transcriptional regulator